MPRCCRFLDFTGGWCIDPSVFLKELAPGKELAIGEQQQREKHNFIVNAVRSRGERIFCLPFPKEGTKRANLPHVPYADLDLAYKSRLTAYMPRLGPRKHPVVPMM